MVNKKILLLDFAQETNSGDDIMQRALIDLCSKHISNQLEISSYFGVNEFPYAFDEFSNYRNDYKINVSGGLYPTLFLKPVLSIFGSTKVSRLFLRIVYALWLAVILLLLRLKAPYSILSKFMSSSQRKALKTYISADIVIWNGRNFRGSGHASEILKIFELCANPLICLLMKKKVFCVGSSVWTLNSYLSRYLIKTVVSKSSLFLVRESKTYAYIKKHVFKNKKCASLKYMPDLSFYSLNKVIQSKNFDAPQEFKKNIALTVVGRREFDSLKVYSRYIESLSKLVGHISSLGYSIVVTPQVTYSKEPYSEVLEYIRSKNPKADINAINKKLSVRELLEIYFNAKVVVATRMHSAIFSGCVGTPVMGVSYDSGAKWDILRDIDIQPSMIIDADIVSPEALINNFNKIISFEKDKNIALKVKNLSNEIEYVFDSFQK